MVTVLLVGMLATLWVGAMTAAVVPMYQKAGQGRVAIQARIAAEAAIDYTLDQFNSSISGGNLGSMDAAALNGSKTTTVPSSVFGGGSKNPTVVTVTVKNIAPTSTSGLYDAQLDVNQAYQQTKLISSNYWRLIEATANVGGTSSAGGYGKTLRAIFRPGYAQSSGLSSMLPAANAGYGTNSTFANYGVFGRGTVNVGPNTTTDGYNSGNYSGTSNPYSSTKLVSNRKNNGAGTDVAASVPLGGDVGSYGTLKMQNSNGVLTGNVTIGGSVDVPLQPAGSTVVAATGTGATTTTVNRYMTVNGVQSGFSSTGSNANVLGAYNSNTTIGMTQDTGRSGNIQIQQSMAQNQLPAAPAVPARLQDITNSSIPVQNLGDVVIGSPTTATTWLFSNTASLPEGTYTIPTDGSTVTLAPGNYSMNSLTIFPGSRIIVANDVDPAVQPVRLFMNNSSTNDVVNVANIQGDGRQAPFIQNQSATPNKGSILPMGLQIYYNGNGNINFTSDTSTGLSAVVYAPNATLNIGYNKSGMAARNYFGAFVAKEINTVNANIHFDRALQQAPYLTDSKRINAYRAPGDDSPGTPGLNVGNGMFVEYLHVASWQEL